MADQNTRPLSPKQIQDDIDAFAALKNIPTYKASNPVYDIANGEIAKADKEAKETKAAQDAATAAASRDDEIASQWGFHAFVLGARQQVVAQYGDSSNEKQAVGLKKKSEYKSPTKKKPTP